MSNFITKSLQLCVYTHPQLNCTGLILGWVYIETQGVKKTESDSSQVVPRGGTQAAMGTINEPTQKYLNNRKNFFAIRWSNTGTVCPKKL